MRPSDELLKRALGLGVRGISLVGPAKQALCGAEEMAEACAAALRWDTGKRIGTDDMRSELADLWVVLPYMTRIFYGEDMGALETIMVMKMEKFERSLLLREAEAKGIAEDQDIRISVSRAEIFEAWGRAQTASLLACEKFGAKKMAEALGL